MGKAKDVFTKKLVHVSDSVDLILEYVTKKPEPERVNIIRVTKNIEKFMTSLRGVSRPSDGSWPNVLDGGWLRTCSENQHYHLVTGYRDRNFCGRFRNHLHQDFRSDLARTTRTTQQQSFVYRLVVVVVVGALALCHGSIHTCIQVKSLVLVVL